MNPSKELISTLMENVTSPDEIDAATTRLAIPAREVNFYLATSLDLTNVGIGKCVYIPIQISNSIKGRESLYKLTPGSKTMAGILVTGEDIYYRFVTRESGKTPYAKTGDVYTEEIRKSDGTILLSGQGKLNIKNPKKGIGEVEVSYKLANGKLIRQRWLWILWSCIYGGNGRRFD